MSNLEVSVYHSRMLDNISTMEFSIIQKLRGSLAKQPWWFSFIILLCANGLSAVQAADKQTGLSIHTFQGSHAGFYSNSHLIISNDKAFMIDAQFDVKNAKELDRFLDKKNISLQSILITHPHPDHFYGLEYLGIKYANTKLYAGPITGKIVDASIARWVKQSGGKLPGLQTIRLLTNNDKVEQLQFGGKLLEVASLINRESVENTVIYVPSMEALFTGDLVSNGFHLWLAEGRIKSWIEALDKLQAYGPVATIYPGHGISGGAELIEETRTYIDRFVQSTTESETTAQAIASMLAYYPNYKLTEVLIASVSAAMETNSQ